MKIPLRITAVTIIASTVLLYVVHIATATTDVENLINTYLAGFFIGTFVVFAFMVSYALAFTAVCLEKSTEDVSSETPVVDMTTTERIAM